MLKLKGKKNYENRAIGHDTSERYESLFSFDRNNIGHFRSVLDLGATARCLCITRKYITRRLENLSKSAFVLTFNSYFLNLIYTNMYFRTNFNASVLIFVQ